MPSATAEGSSWRLLAPCLRVIKLHNRHDCNSNRTGASASPSAFGSEMRRSPSLTDIAIVTSPLEPQPSTCPRNGAHDAQCFVDNGYWAVTASQLLTAVCEPLMNQCGMSHFDTLMVGFAQLRDRGSSAHLLPFRRGFGRADLMG